jgi:hypothetical protein
MGFGDLTVKPDIVSNTVLSSHRAIGVNDDDVQESRHFILNR